jgi:hypothetical protein
MRIDVPDRQGLARKVAGRVKLAKLRAYARSFGDDTMDEVAIRLNARPTYDEEREAEAWVNVVLDELEKV